MERRRKSINGQWETIFESQVVGIHSALLNNGKVLLFSYKSKDSNHSHGSSNGGSHNHSHGSADSIGDSEVVDIFSKTSQRIDLQRNIFCGGTCFLDDGRLLVAGGQYPTIYKIINPPCNDINTFDPLSNNWRYLSESDTKLRMKGRWYPTCLTLSNGQAIIISGRYSFYQIHFWIFKFVNNTLQSFANYDNSLSTPRELPFKVDLYPFMHLLPDGKIFVHSNNTTRLYDSLTNTWIRNENNNLTEIKTNYKYSRTNPGQGTSVLLPLTPYSNPPYNPKILLIGGAGSNNPGINTPATNTVEKMDFKEANLRWQQISSMNHRRVMPDSVILPDQTVFVVNGSGKGRSDQAVDPVLEPEIFNPFTETWTKAQPMNIPRLYHATALLLPDGSILTTGTDGEWNKPPFNQDQKNLELFRPWYFFESSRPEITNQPDEVLHNEKFKLRYSHPKAINKVVIIRPSSVTHSLNTEQRLVELELLSKSVNELELKSPPNGLISPPGYYMLFLIDEDGIPSRSRFMRISINQQTANEQRTNVV
ncbi:MAG TPA: galactose oxidase-like domain-containing protein [Candidatus Saccharimonadales bacterium]|nr:galactose oxidase-like domain-containing protein [Candidatus Saccharimonadales bacterium]